MHLSELARYLAATARNDVLARPDERRANVPPALTEVLVLDEWHHPDVCAEQLPSASTTFPQLARVLATGDVTHYRPTPDPNTHWRFWPDGGQL